LQAALNGLLTRCSPQRRSQWKINTSTKPWRSSRKSGGQELLGRAPGRLC
jgi:hypothetical protein